MLLQPQCVLTSSIPVAEIRKSPQITQTHGVAKAREKKVQFTAPVAPGVFDIAVLGQIVVCFGVLVLDPVGQHQHLLVGLMLGRCAHFTGVRAFLAHTGIIL